MSGDIPNSVYEIFEDHGGYYHFHDYDHGMDNIESMSFFLDLIGCEIDDIVEDMGTLVVLVNKNYDFKIVIESHGLGDFYSHAFEAYIHEDDQIRLDRERVINDIVDDGEI